MLTALPVLSFHLYGRQRTLRNYFEEHHPSAVWLAQPFFTVHEECSCSKRLPKPFRTVTSLSIVGCAKYRRRNDGRSVICRGISMDNRFVVPYSPYLTHMFRTHISVEVCALLHVVKYVYEYVYKGPERTPVRLRQMSDNTTTHDEVDSYIDARYVCASAGIHRAFGFKMDERSVSVVRLQTHLASFEIVSFVEGAEQLARRPLSAR